MRSSKPDYLNWALVALLGGFILLIALYIKQNRERSALAARSASLQASEARTAPASGAKSTAPRAAPAAARPIVKKPAKKPADDFQTALKRKSEENLRQFTQLAKIEFQLPGNIQFLPFELDDDMAGLHGFDGTNKTNLTALAYPKNAEPAEALAFFKSELTHFPGAEGASLRNLSEAQPLPTIPDSDLRKGTMWNGQLSNGDEVYVVFLGRADAKGSYMFVYTGPPAYFQANDGAFDSIYDSARALPAK